MDCQSFGRSQRAKGAKIREALQIILVLAVCVWLVYQIRHSTSNRTHEFGAVSMGHKGTDERALSKSGNAQIDGAMEKHFAKYMSSGRIHAKSKRSESHDSDHKVPGNKGCSTKRVMKDSQSDSKKPGIGIRQVEINKKSRWDGSNKEANAEDESEMQENAVETGVDFDDLGESGSLVDEFHSFHDKNGVPPEENETGHPLEEIIPKFGMQS